MQTREERIKKQRIIKRKVRTRKKLLFLKTHPRLSVFRSNVKIYAQIIDDKQGITLVAVNESELKDGGKTRVERAGALGELLAKKAIDKKIKEVVFDKGAYKYHGRVKSFAEGARKGGLVF